MKYEKQTGSALPDTVLAAILLNKTSGALQTHLRLNARTLTTYEEIRTTILEYHLSRRILTGASSSSNQGRAPMDIGGLEGKKGFGKGRFGRFEGKKGRGKKRGKLGQVKGTNPHITFTVRQWQKEKEKTNECRNFVVGMLWFVGLAERAATLRRSAFRAVSAHLMRMRHLKVKNLVTKVGMRMIGPQILGLRTGGLMTWLELCLVMELGMMIGGGRPGMMVGVMRGQTLLGVLFNLLLLRRLLPLLHRRLLSQNATSGAPVSAVTLETVPTSKARATATSKAAPKALGFASAALTFGSMLAGISSCVVAPPFPDVSLEGMLDGCVAFSDFSVAGACDDSPLQFPT